MSTYSLLLDLDGFVRDDAVLRDDGVFVLATPDSTDPDALGYQEWLQAGNSPSKPIPTPQPITEVSAAQARIALLNVGLLAPAETKAKAAGGATAIWWEYATTWHRSNQYVNTLGASMGLSDAAIDLLFKQAAEIQ